VLLSTNAYVRVFALDFSKAFDTVRHAVLMEKMAELRLPNEIYNWIKGFFGSHSHCTKYSGEIPEQADIHASVIQGSGLGPVSYLVMAAYLRPCLALPCVIPYLGHTGPHIDDNLLCQGSGFLQVSSYDVKPILFGSSQPSLSVVCLPIYGLFWQSVIIHPQGVS